MKKTLLTATGQQKWRQTTQRLVQTATATKKSANTIEKNTDMASSLLRKTTGFEIQTRDIVTPFRGLFK